MGLTIAINPIYPTVFSHYIKEAPCLQVHFLPEGYPPNYPMAVLITVLSLLRQLAVMVPSCHLSQKLILEPAYSDQSRHQMLEVGCCKSRCPDEVWGARCVLGITACVGRRKQGWAEGEMKV